MRRVWYFVLFSAVFLAGCGNLPKSTGFEVQPRSFVGRQEPWTNMVLTGRIEGMFAISVAFVSFPDPLPSEWERELVDRSRIYEVWTSDGTREKRVLERVVFRAVLFQRGRDLVMYDAMAKPASGGFFVLLPPGGEEYEGSNLVILSSSGDFLMTTRGEKVELEGLDITRLPADFFARHPSALTQVVSMGKGNPVGREFFQELEHLFPVRFGVAGTDYSGIPGSVEVAKRFTKVEEPLDKFVSCGTLPLGPGVLNPVTAGIVFGRNLHVMVKKDCFE